MIIRGLVARGSGDGHGFGLDEEGERGDEENGIKDSLELEILESGACGAVGDEVFGGEGDEEEEEEEYGDEIAEGGEPFGAVEGGLCLK